jgi:hypothetical protein
MPEAKKSGSSVKRPTTDEVLRGKGLSTERAAKISNE